MGASSMSVRYTPVGGVSDACDLASQERPYCNVLYILIQHRLVHLYVHFQLRSYGPTTVRTLGSPKTVEGVLFVQCS